MLFQKPDRVKRGNTIRKISPEVAELVKARDRSCRICKISPIEHIHHAYYGSSSNYGPTRNDPDQLIGLCTQCHHHLHFDGGNNYRHFCISYLQNLG